MHTLTAFQVADMPLPSAVLSIRAGLPASAFDGVARVLSLTSSELAQKLGISLRTVNDQKRKLARLSRENSEKLVRIARVQKLAKKIFTTDQAVSQWLALPAPALEGVAPLDLLDTDLGTREVEGLINGLAYGNVL